MVARSAAAQIPDVRRFDRRILRYLNEFRRSIASSVMIGMVGSAFAALQPWPIKLLIDGVLVAEPEAAAWLDYVPAVAAGPIAISAVLAAGFVLFAGLEALCNATAFYLMARTALEMIHRLRMRLLAHVYSLSLRFHTNTPVGDTIWRAINDARSIQELLIIGVRTCTVLVFRVLAMLALMLLIDVPLTLASILMLPLLYVAIAVLSPRIQRASILGRERMGRLTALIEQGLVAIRAVQTSGAEDFERGRLERASLDFVRTQLRFRLAEPALRQRPT